MRYATVCSGVEAPSLAWQPLGWEVQWLSEIEPFPSALLEHYYGNEAPNLGDMTELEKRDDLGSIDLLFGGTPCQSFSVAGLRGGLEDARGNLALVFCRLVAKLRPTWVVWENVPGVLSSNGGRDFGAIVGAMAELGYGWAYRILDAQYFGVPQRRRRVFLVCHLGDWRRAAAVLFEPESLRRNPAPSREARQDVAGTVSARTQGGGGLGTDFELGGGLVPEVTHALRGEGFDASEDGTGRGTPLVTTPAVRRLTPRECERLMGFPDDYTLVPFRGKPASDSQRYKAIGNSIAVPCLAWIGRRIAATHPTGAEE